MPKDNKNNSMHDVFEALIAHEDAIAELYQVYETCTGDPTGFWKKLIMEERAHSAVLKELHDRFSQKKIFADFSRFNPVAISTAINYIRKKIEQAKADGITQKAALITARDVEGTIIEHDFFRLYKSRNYSDEKEIDALEEHTAEHFERIKSELEKTNQP